MKITLDKLKIGQNGKIISIKNNDDISRRLFDMGFTVGTSVSKKLKNYGGNLSAYLVRGTLIAIRNNDSKNIIVEVQDE